VYYYHLSGILVTGQIGERPRSETVKMVLKLVGELKFIVLYWQNGDIILRYRHAMIFRFDVNNYFVQRNFLHRYDRL